jgi:MFS family permease
MAKTKLPRLDFETLRAIPKSVWALGIVSLLMDISSEMIHGLLPIYLVTVLGASTVTVGVIEGIAEATAACVKIFSGSLSDVLGRRKRLTTIGYALAAVTKPVFPLAPTIGWLIAARFVDRIGKGIREAPRDALLADVTPDALRGASYGLRQSLDTIGAFAGPLVAIGLMWATANNFTIVFWIAVIPAFLAVAVMIFGVQEPDRPATARKPKSILSIADLKRLDLGYWRAVALAVVFTLARFSEAFLLLKATSVGLSVMMVPAVLVVTNVVYALVAYPAGVASDSGRRTRFLPLGFACLIAADLILAFATDITVAMIGVAVWGLHLGLTQGVLTALVADVAPKELRGTAFGIYNLLVGLALLAASVLAGVLWDWAGPRATFLAGAAFAAIALTGYSTWGLKLPADPRIDRSRRDRLPVHGD